MASTSRPRHQRPPGAPRELTGPIFVRQPGLFGGLFGLPFLVMGTAAVVQSLNRGAETWQVAIPAFFVLYGANLIRNGVKTWDSMRRSLVYGDIAEGEIIDTRFVPGSRRPVFDATYRFTTPAGELTLGSKRTLSTDIAEYQEGDPIWVVYDPEEPTNNQIWPPVLTSGTRRRLTR